MNIVPVFDETFEHNHRTSFCSSHVNILCFQCIQPIVCFSATPYIIFHAGYKRSVYCGCLNSSINSHDPLSSLPPNYLCLRWGRDPNVKFHRSSSFTPVLRFRIRGVFTKRLCKVKSIKPDNSFFSSWNNVRAGFFPCISLCFLKSRSRNFGFTPGRDQNLKFRTKKDLYPRSGSNRRCCHSSNLSLLFATIQPNHDPDPYIDTLVIGEQGKMDVHARYHLLQFCAMKGTTIEWQHRAQEKSFSTRLWVPLPTDLQLVSGYKDMSVAGKAKRKNHAVILACMMALRWLKKYANCDVKEELKKARLDTRHIQLHAMNRANPGVDIVKLVEAVRERDGDEHAYQISALIRLVILMAADVPVIRYFPTQAKFERRMTVNVYCYFKSPEKELQNQKVKLVGTAFGTSEYTIPYIEAMAFKMMSRNIKKLYRKDVFKKYFSYVYQNPNVAMCSLRPQLADFQRSKLQDALVDLEKYIVDNAKTYALSIEGYETDFLNHKISKRYLRSKGNDSDCVDDGDDDGNGTDMLHPTARLSLAPLHLSIIEARMKLPVDALRYELIEKLKFHPIVIVYGGTGSGKTTRIPQFLLDDALENGHAEKCSIIVTQPRRIAVVSSAARVASERYERLGGRNASVGYHIRLERKRPRPKGSIEFVTTGLLLRRLQNPNELDHVSHIVLDEVHERDKDTDLVLIALKEMLKTRSINFRLIVMSATIDSFALNEYLNHCPVLTVPTGPLFSVREFYLDDIQSLIRSEPLKDQLAPINRRSKPMEGSSLRDVMVDSRDPYAMSLVMRAKFRESQLLKLARKDGGDTEALFQAESYYCNNNEESYDMTLCKIMAELILFLIKNKKVPPAGINGGAVLCFLPGWDEIQKVKSVLAQIQKKEPGILNQLKLHSLHSSIPGHEQMRVFDPVPFDKIKVILSTNIAETSITIGDVTVVIDSGRVKELCWHPVSKFSSLNTVYCSKASMTQRRGRAGRVREGICYRLYSKTICNRIMKQYDTPEMVRCSLEGLILQAKAITKEPVASFLSKALNPPNAKRVELAISELTVMGALTAAGESVESGDEQEEQMTCLGWHLATLPVEPLVGRMVMLGILFRAVDAALTIAACVSTPELFSVPNDRALIGSIQEKFSRSSDVLAMTQAFELWETALELHGAVQADRVKLKYQMTENTLHLIRATKVQLCETLTARGLLPGYMDEKSGAACGGSHDELNENSDSAGIRLALVCSALTNLGHRVGEYHEILTRRGTNATIHASSVCGSREGVSGRSAWYTYLELIQTRRFHIRCNTCVSPLEIVLFGGRFVYEYGGWWLIDDWISCKGRMLDLDLLVGARKAMYIALQMMSMDMESGWGGSFTAFVRVMREILDETESGRAEASLQPIQEEISKMG